MKYQYNLYNVDSTQKWHFAGIEKSKIVFNSWTNKTRFDYFKVIY